MSIRSYTKQELALRYFPDATPAVASAHLMRWLQRCAPLMEQLRQSGYSKHDKVFTPIQVAHIVHYLGEP